jgi:hypothetical protein
MAVNAPCNYCIQLQTVLGPIASSLACVSNQASRACCNVGFGLGIFRQLQTRQIIIHSIHKHSYLVTAPVQYAVLCIIK